MEKNSYKILIVDDDPYIRDVYSTELRFGNLKVEEAANGEEGLQKIADEKPDLVLLDILMPVMDGLTMLKQLRQTGDYGKNLPVILLTNMSAGDEKIIKNIAETEPLYYFVKSDLSVTELSKKVKEVLAKINSKK